MKKDELTIEDAIDLVTRRSDKIFNDREVFSHNHIPNKISHRSEEIKNIIDSISDSGKHSIVFLKGDHGVGKTVITKFLQRVFLKKKTFAAYFDHISSTEYTVLRKICSSLAPENKIGRSISKGWEVISQIPNNYIIIIDNAIYNSWLGKFIKKFLEITTSSILVASTDIMIDQKIFGRNTFYTPNSFMLGYYTVNQIKDILSSRSNELGGFKEGVVGEDVLSVCAATTKREFNADCRYGLQLLYNAGNLLEEEVSTLKVVPVMTHDHLLEAYASMKYKGKDIEFGDTADILLLILIYRDRDIKMPDLLRDYEKLVRSTGDAIYHRSTLYRELSKMQERGLIRIAKKGGRGNVTWVALDIKIDTLLRQMVNKRGEDYVKKYISYIKSKTNEVSI